MKGLLFLLYLYMPIPVSTLNAQILADLDAEGSDRYLFDQDIKPAVNSAIDVVVALFNQAFADDKLSPEQLRELTKVRVWQASQYSRVAYSEADNGHPLWTIIAVYPKPVTNKNASSSSSNIKSFSKLRPDVSFLESFQSAKRLTLEEWNDNTLNVFMPGNTLLSVGGLTEYAYLDFADYSSTSYTGNNNLPEIQIRPAIPGELVAISYLKTPNRVSTINDSVEFPQSLTRLFVDICLNYISIKQGDSTNLFGITSQNVQRLSALMK